VPPTTPPSRPLLRRFGTVALAAALGTAALPAVDAAAAVTTSSAQSSQQPSARIPGMHEVTTHFTAIKRRNTPVAHKSRGTLSVTASDGTTASLVPAPPDGPARSTWVVNYDAGFTSAASGPQAQAAFQAAVDIWSHIVYSPVPIVVNASYADLGGNTLGQAAAAQGFYCGCIGDGVHVYPVALANALYGSDISPSNPDIVAQFNSNPVAPFYYGTDGAPTSGMVDFESVVMHELGHGLGFAGSMTMSNGNVVYSSPSMKWDTFLVDNAGNPMLGYASGSAQLTTAMESPLYWSGTDGSSANGGTRPTMYAPAAWEQGSSGGAHLDETTYGRGDANSLMSPQISAQEAVHTPGADAVAMFRDIGWTAALPTGSAPTAPTGVTATRGDGSASVSWNASTDYGNAVTQYVATASPGGATCSTNGALNCTVTGLTNGTSYTFTVTATNSIGTSAASTASSAVVPAGTPATPAAPTGSPNDGGAVVSWTAPSGNGAAITGYDVQSSADNGTTWSTGLASALTSTATQATFTGLTNGTAYVFRVAAINSVGEGTMSPKSAAVTPAAGASAPGAPTGLQTTRGDTQVSVSWTAPADDGGSAITGYRVEWSSDSGATWSQPLASALTSTTPAATVTGLTNGTSYVFHVAAVNAIGTGAFSGTSAATPAGQPGAPTNVTGAPGNGQVTASWSAPSSNGDPITGYDVESSTDGTNWSAALPSALTSTATSAVLSSLTNGQAYHFRVAAINGVGTGTPTATTGTVTPATVPGAPTNVMATRGNTQATLSWTAPSDNGGAAITSYRFRYSTDSGAHWATISGTAPGSPVTFTGMTNGVAYLFGVAAINSAGTGAFSASSNAVTPATTPGAPTLVSGSPGDGQVSVSWTAPTSTGGDPISGYDVEWSSDNGAHWSSPLAAAQSSTSTAALVTGLTNGTSYVFKVAARNGVGAGAFSTVSSAVTPAGAPATPTGAGATAGDQQATVSWTAGSDGGSAITSYDVRYSTDGGTSWTSLGVAYAGSPAVVTGLTNGTSYLFDVAAINGVGASAYSDPTSAVVPSGLPGTPTGVSASGGNGQATVSWTAPSANGSAITGYAVRYSTDSGAHWTSAGAAVAGSPTTVTGLGNGTSYVFDVAAVNANGTGNYSSASSAVTPSTTPATPAFATVTPGNGSVSLTWTAPANGGSAITGYAVETSSDDGAHWSAPLASALTSTATSATVTGLTNGTGYAFRIAATNANGTGSFSDPSSAVTPLAVPDAPTAVTVTGDNGSATVSWTAPADNGDPITAYEVRYSTDSGTSWTSAGTAYASSPVTVTGLSNGTAYVFDVAASNSAGQGAFSAASGSVTPATVPGAPTQVAGSAGDGQVSVSWTAPSSNGGNAISGYDVEWSTDGGTTWSAPLAAAQSSTSTVASVTGLTNGTAYVFRVAAINGVGTGAFSGSSSGVTPATVPGTPTAAGATSSDQSATVSWTAPANGGSAITSYDVRYSTDGGTSWTSLGVAYAGSPAVVSGLTNGTSYRFDVAAINGVGASSYSDPTSAVVPAGVPAAPTAVTATRGDGQASVAWTGPSANGSALTGFTVRYSTDGGTSWTTVGTSYSSSPAVVTGLTNGTSYVFDVAATNGVGTGTYSSASTGVVPAGVPAVPTGVTATRGNAQATVSWTNPSGNGAALTGFQIRYSTDNGSTWSAGAPYSSSPAIVTGLTNGTSYVFEVAATNAVGTGSYSTQSAAVVPARAPAAPGSVTATRGNASASVSWTTPADNGSAITSYVVRYSTDGTHWTPAAQSYDGSPATVTGLTNGTSYVFDVAAVNAIGTGTFSAASSSVTPATTPDPPTSVVGTSGPAQVSVAWTPGATGGSAVTSYTVRYSTDGGSTWTTVGTAFDASPAVVTGLANGTPYVFEVLSTNDVGSSSYSTASDAVTPAAVPDVPTDLSATRGNASASVSWTAPAANGSPITSYAVRYSSNGGTTWTTASGSFGGSPATVTGLTNGTPYVFEVAATNAAGTGGYSAISGAITPATTPDPPTSVGGSRGGDGAVALTWIAPADGGDAITGYTVEWSSDGGTTWSSPLGSALTSTDTAASVTGLTDGTAYIFRVAATNGVGIGTFSDTSGAVTPATVPDVPTEVTAVAGDQQASVSWQPPANGGTAITSYDVRYSGDGGTTWTSAAVAFTHSPATVTGLTNGTDYVFEVAALNDVGLGGYSTPSTAVTPWRDASSLTNNASMTVKYGTTVVLSTTLRDTTTGLTMGGYAVQLLARTSTGVPWHVVTTASTSWVGTAKVSVKPSARTLYMWQFNGVPGHAAAGSGTQTVSVAQVVTVAQTATSIVHGGVVKFYGVVSPNEVNQYVYLQVLLGGSWKTTAVKAQIVKQRLPNGVTTVGYVLALKTGSTGSFSYRVNRPATLANAAGVSKTVTLRVT